MIDYDKLRKIEKSWQGVTEEEAIDLNHRIYQYSQDLIHSRISVMKPGDLVKFYCRKRYIQKELTGTLKRYNRKSAIVLVKDPYRGDVRWTVSKSLLKPATDPNVYETMKRRIDSRA